MPAVSLQDTAVILFAKKIDFETTMMMVIITIIIIDNHKKINYHL